MTLGKRIKAYRVSMGMKQCELADKIGTNQANVSFWERDSFTPSLLFLCCLADVFDITLDELVGRRERNGKIH